MTPAWNLALLIFNLVFTAFILTYEVVAVRTRRATISQQTWAVNAQTGALAFFVGLGSGLLFGHLFL